MTGVEGLIIIVSMIAGLVVLEEVVGQPEDEDEILVWEE